MSRPDDRLIVVDPEDLLLQVRHQRGELGVILYPSRATGEEGISREDVVTRVAAQSEGDGSAGMTHQADDVEFDVAEAEDIPVPHRAAGHAGAGLDGLGVGFAAPGLGARRSNDVSESSGVVGVTVGRDDGADLVVADEGLEPTGFRCRVDEDGRTGLGTNEIGVVVHRAHRHLDEVNILVDPDELSPRYRTDVVERHDDSFLGRAGDPLGVPVR